VALDSGRGDAAEVSGDVVEVGFRRGDPDDKVADVVVGGTGSLAAVEFAKHSRCDPSESFVAVARAWLLTIDWSSAAAVVSTSGYAS